MDCANGVGGVHAATLFKPFGDSVKLRNTEVEPGLLNNEVGSEFVARHLSFPRSLGDLGEGER